ncbi:MAG TPA: S41 family peptidase [Nocardioides sp.]|jgi:C-terminal processing protease CtpA/Prc|nr:S41 family peptidase [Nocardioides sp.]
MTAQVARTGVSLADLRTDRSRSAAGALDGGQRLQVLDALATVLDGCYAHLPAKRAAYASDPVQALALLRRRATELTDAEFHLATSGIVTGLRDAHTRYLGPSTQEGLVAVLPFLVEQYGPEEDPRFLVSKVNDDAVDDAEFVRGCRLESWNGVPFTRAVEVYADRETGGRPDARRARALESLTFRALQYGPPPDEDWVVVGYRTARGARRETRFPWRLVEPGAADAGAGDGVRGALRVAKDPAAEAVRRAKKLQFAYAAWVADRARAGRPVAAPAADGAGPVATSLPDQLSARILPGRVGYLRIWTFDVADDTTFVDEVARLVGLLPQERLIVDLRGNPGGLIWAAERTLQLFSQRPISPTRFSLLATPLTRMLAASPFNRLELESWRSSLDDSVSTGDLWSQPLPLTDPAWCNDLGRRYPGQAVAVVDPNTYSSGDLFAAGWVDHRIGPLVSVGRGTGAGGANVWTAAQLRDAMAGTDRPLPAMPAGTGFTLAFRRAIRSADGDGIPIEDLGVSGIPYAMTRRDLLHDNVDLLAFCIRQLA